MRSQRRDSTRADPNRISPSRGSSKQLNEDPEPPSRVVEASLSPDLEAFVLECLAKKPEGRPGDAGVALDRLERIASEIGESSQVDAREWWETTPRP